MPDDTHDDVKARHTPHTRRETYQPVHTDDRFKRRVRADHAPNAALHAALRAAFGPSNDAPTVNLMASHAPGEKDHDPTFDVWVESRNDGGGHPMIPKVVRRMVDRDDAVITGVVECSDDHLIVSLRAVETRVEPVEVRIDDIPDRFVDLDGIEHDAAVVLRKCVDEYGVESDRTAEAARSLSTVLYTADPDRYAEFVDDSDAAPRAAYRQLWRRAGVDPDTNDVTNLRPTGDGYEWEGEDDDRVPDDVVEAIRDPDGRVVDGSPITHTDVDDEDDAVDAARHLLHSGPYAGFPYAEAGDFPMTRPPIEPIREWVEDHRHTFLADKGDARDVAETIADAIENFVVSGRVDPDRVDVFDDHDPDDRGVHLRVTVDGDEYRDVVREGEQAVGLPDEVDVYAGRIDAFDVARIPCGCGEYAVCVPSGSDPDAIDVVCPECGNHFGHDATDGVRYPFPFGVWSTPRIDRDKGRHEAVREWVDAHRGDFADGAELTDDAVDDITVAIVDALVDATFEHTGATNE